MQSQIRKLMTQHHPATRPILQLHGPAMHRVVQNHGKSRHNLLVELHRVKTWPLQFDVESDPIVGWGGWQRIRMGSAVNAVQQREFGAQNGGILGLEGTICGDVEFEAVGRVVHPPGGGIGLGSWESRHAGGEGDVPD